MPSDSVDLTRGFESRTAGLGVLAFAKHYQSSRFAGRQAAIHRLHDWASSPARFAVVAGEAGRGKSALLLRFAEQLSAAGARVLWIPISLRFGTSRGHVVRGLAVARLRALGLTGTGDWVDMLRSAHPPVVIVDGVDEAQDDAVLSDLRALATTPSSKVLISYALHEPRSSALT